MANGTLEIGSYFGPYNLERLIAIGGMAEIYLARTRGLAGFEKQLVLKVIQPDFAGNDQFVQMLVNEAKIAVGLNHPNIAQTFDLGKIGSSYFITMEYVDGADFFDVLKGLSDMEVDIPIEAALHVVQETLNGLEYAHTKTDPQGKPLHIIHRDISPQNILLSRHGEVKIVDFGIAKAANLSHKTRAGTIKGKLVYMSPEQAWGDKVDRRADVFSAGIVLYEALTMGSLYLDNNPAKLLEKVRKAAIEPPSYRRQGIPAEVDALVMKALSPRPADRYQSAAEFAAALAGYQHRTAPGYTEQDLGDLVEAVLSGEKPRRGTGGPSASRTGEMMVREDFAVQEHSMIFSAEDLMESSPMLPRAAPELVVPATVPPASAGPAPASGGRPVAKLVLLDDREGETHVLGETFVVGRAGDMRLGDARVSRRHASIRRQADGSYLLEDLKSSNGTYLNGDKIDQPCVLSTGDVVRIGPFEMRFLLEIAAPARPAEALPPTDSRRSRRSSPSAEMRRVDASRLAVTMGDERLTLPIGASLRLAHTVALEAQNLEGEAATLVRRPDGYWIEPAAGQEPVRHNGQALSAPTRLAHGDRLEVGPLELEFVEGE